MRRKKDHSTIQQEMKLADRESFLVKVWFFWSMSFEIRTFWAFVGMKLLANPQNTANLKFNQ